MKRKIAGLLVGAALLGGTLAYQLPQAHATPPLPTQTGCPSGAQILSVATFVAAGYNVQPIDVNADGTICGHPLPNAWCEVVNGVIPPVGVCPKPFGPWIFSDNDSPAVH